MVKKTEIALTCTKITADFVSPVHGAVSLCAKCGSARAES